MKFFMCSNSGDGAGILHRIQQEGNQVELYIQDPNYSNAWDGILPKASKIAPPPGAIVIFDGSGMGQIADKLKKAKFAVVGGSVWADKMERDRVFGLDAMKSCGIRVPDTYEGKSLSDVKAILDEHGDSGKRWYFKPSGKKELPAHLTYCGFDDADLLKFVEYVGKNYSSKVEGFVLQEKIDGVCVSSEGWFDGTRFVRPWNHTVEVKAAMNCNLGPATGCSGNLVWSELGNCRIISEGVSRIESMAAEAGYVGPIDLNTIVNDEAVVALEWTCRFGYDATPTYLSLFWEGEVGKFFCDIAKAQLSRGIPADSMKVAAGVRLTIPPYPLDASPKDLKEIAPNVGIPIRGIESEDLDNFYFYEVMEDDNGDLFHSSGTGIVACVTATDYDADKAFCKIYDLLDQVKIPDKQYRTDIGECLGHMCERVKMQDQLQIEDVA